MAVQNENIMTGTKKASMLLLALGTTKSAQVLKHLSEQEIEKLSAEIVQMRRVDPVMTQLVIEEFQKTSASGATAAGRDFAARVLDQVLGPEKTKDVLQKAGHTGTNQPFGFLYRADTAVIAELLIDELPQIGSLVLVNLPPEKAASVLSELPVGIQAEIAKGICSMGEVDPEAIPAIEEALKAKIGTVGRKPASFGPQTLVRILNNSGRSTERLILDALSKGDPSVGEQVRQMMFVFEDLVRFDDRSLMSILRKIEPEDLQLALRNADDRIKERLFNCMSERAVEMIKEEISLSGPVKARDVEAAQQRITAVVRELLESGEISSADEEEYA